VQRRVGEHEGKGRFSARFTRAFSPVELVYYCCVGAKSLAYQVEYRIKRLPREKKAQLIEEACSKAGLLALLNINA
jgi:predicted GIY-YIG superfamily endonuclease